MPDAKYRSTFETLRREIMLGKFDASRKFPSEDQLCRQLQNLLFCFTQSTLSSQSNFKSETSRIRWSCAGGIERDGDLW